MWNRVFKFWFFLDFVFGLELWISNPVWNRASRFRTRIWIWNSNKQLSKSAKFERKHRKFWIWNSNIHWPKRRNLERKIGHKYNRAHILVQSCSTLNFDTIVLNFEFLYNRAQILVQSCSTLNFGTIVLKFWYNRAQILVQSCSNFGLLFQWSSGHCFQFLHANTCAYIQTLWNRNKLIFIIDIHSHIPVNIHTHIHVCIDREEWCIWCGSFLRICVPVCMFVCMAYANVHTTFTLHMNASILTYIHVYKHTMPYMKACMY
jgi:hypothetical protein